MSILISGSTGIDIGNSKTHYQSDGGGITTVQPSTTAVNSYGIRHCTMC